MWLGVDYYPEHWPEERWPVDAALMADAGLNIARMGEFAWSRLEPEEGRFDFAWLDRAVAILHERGIMSVLGTPTAAPPAWLIQKHPDILPVDHRRQPKAFGMRRHYCPNNTHFHDATRRIVAALADHFAANPAVVGWQIDNEFGCHDTTRCYCDACVAAFRLWLRKHYGTLDCLNSAWGTIFWSQQYTDWAQIPLPWLSVEQQLAHNPSLLLDFFRFASDAIVAYQGMQVDILRDLCPQHFVTHNMMGLFDEIDYFDLGVELDFASFDNYPNYADASPHWTGMALDVTRGIRACNFWVMEQQAGPTGWRTLAPTPRPGLIRCWTWQAVAHGADAVLFFRWRTSRFGTEQLWHGILDHDGEPRRRYREVQQIGREVREHAAQWSASCPRNEVAFILSYQQDWALQIQPHNLGLTYWGEVYRLYQPLRKLGVGVDFIAPESRFSGYKLIVAPLLLLMDEPLACKLRDYVERGGTLIGTFRSGVKDCANAVTDRPLPGLLAEVFGIRVAEYDAMPGATPNYVSFEGREGRYVAKLWADVIELRGARALATFTGDWYAGSPALTANSLGAGTACYLATAAEHDFYTEFLGGLLDGCRVARLKGLPPNIDACIRYRDGTRILFLLNPMREPARVPLDGEYRSLLENTTASGETMVPGYGAAILKQLDA